MAFIRDTTAVDADKLAAMETTMESSTHPPTWFAPVVGRNRLSGDLQVLPSGDAGTAAALYDKQLRSSGCQSMAELIERHRQKSDGGLTAIMMASDVGPDQQRQKTLANASGPCRGVAALCN